MPRAFTSLLRFYRVCLKRTLLWTLNVFPSLGLSDRAQSGIRRDFDAEQKSSSPDSTPLPRATSFVSVRSAQKRDHAAEKWFTGIRELDISDVNQPSDLKSPPRKRRRSESPKKHEMRPRTDLNALFAPSTTTSLRIQTKKELAGNYTSYLPDGYPDPHRFPVAYARLVLGRNKHIPLNVQTGALNIVEEVIKGRTTRQGK